MKKTVKPSSNKAAAAALVQKLEQQRGGQNLMLYKVVKTQASTPDVMSADPELQTAFVEHVVEIFAKLGASKGKKPKEWFRGKNVPHSSEEIVRLLLRKELPLTDEALAGMFEKLSRISFLSSVQFREQLAQYLEKFAKKNVLSPRLRQCAGRYADVLAVRHCPKSEAAFWSEEWNLPNPTDRKTVARIDKLLSHLSHK